MISEVQQTSLHAAVFNPTASGASNSTSFSVWIQNRPQTFSAQTCLSSCSFLPGVAGTQGGGSAQAYIFRYFVEPGGNVFTTGMPNAITNVAGGVLVTFWLTVEAYEGQGNLATADSLGTVFVQG